MTLQQLRLIRKDLIQLQLSVAVGSDIYAQCNEALSNTEDLMVDMMSTFTEEQRLQVIKNLSHEVAVLTTQVFGHLAGK